MMNEVGDAGRRLKDACLSGSVAALEALINEDELILDRVSSLTGFINDSTPLHVAALRGHLDFAKALLTRKPDLATELDSSRSSPLHLACTKGHFEIVEELLRVNTDVCIGRDEDGRIPLHLAAIKGRVDVIPALLRVVPESIHEKLDSGETVLHLCVKYNMLEALKTLVKYLQKNNKESLLSSGDNDGNNILHLAAALKQMTTIKYLLEIKIVKDDANVKNRKGFTALDFVEHCPNRDLKTMEILEFLFQAGLRRPACGGSNSMPESPGNPPQRRSKAGVLQRIYLFWIMYFKINPTWLREVRGHLITTAILTATLAYQALLTPPDGFLDVSGTNGNPLDDYVLVNTLVVIGSFCTIMLALSGFPAENKFLMWLLIFTVYVTIICMSRGYFLLFSFQAAGAGRATVSRRSTILWYIWIGLCGFVFLLHACHFFVWLWNKFENLKWLRNMFGDLVKTRSRSSECGVVINIPR